MPEPKTGPNAGREPIAEGHTHVRVDVAADRPRAHVSLRVLFYGPGGEALQEPEKVGHLTCCTSAAAGEESPGVFAGERAQDVPIPPGAAAFAVDAVKTSDGARADVEAASLRVRIKPAR